MDFSSCKALLSAGKAINYDGAAGTNDVDATGNAHSGYGVFRVGRAATGIAAVDEARISTLIATLH
ncbi:hypothetical protein [Aestuariibius sp. HNIBRBA575]|uniref:hypothetical protein n=1 Tax=Aestuariibius sp. HNIBRBA575 TaxID=3233343 RepID=UPI0034A2B631